MPRSNPAPRYDRPFMANDAHERGRAPGPRYTGRIEHETNRPLPRDRGYAAGGGRGMDRGPVAGYDRGFAPWGGQDRGRYDRAFRGGYDRDAGGFGAGNLYNRIMGYGRDYAPREHGSRPAGPTHNWGQGSLASSRRRGGYDRDVRPRGGYDGTWFY